MAFLLKIFLLLYAICFLSFISSENHFSPNLAHDSTLKSLCESTPYPRECLDALKVSLGVNINPNILSFLLQALNSAVTEATKFADLFSSVKSGIIEGQKNALQDCRDLHQITLISLQKSQSRMKNTNSRNVADAKTFLSAALTNKNTCLEGLESASGPSKSTFINSLTNAYAFVSNSLSLISKNSPKSVKERKLSSYPSWLKRKDRRILQSSGNDYDPSSIIIVARDGSGNFTTITDAIDFAPSDSEDRTIILIKAGVYEENVEIPQSKINIVLYGEGRDVTIVRGTRSVGGGYTTFRSATFAVSGDGFLARDIAFQNAAGPQNHQAVALRVNADLVAIYRCTIDGYQDSLYVHSFRQFYRECDIFGTVDFIFGNAAVIFQGCNIIPKKPMEGQFNAITAQSRDDPDENTGISIQNCSIYNTDDLGGTKTYLGRPWKQYSRTVYVESYIGDLVDPAGWSIWSGDEGLSTLYYGEYQNVGPGSSTDNRVSWPGYHVMDYFAASDFAAASFITGDEWLPYTAVPYDNEI